MGLLNSAALCPFYIKDNPKNSTITCEGRAGVKNVQNNFRNKKQLTQYAERYCLTNDFRKCDLYISANKKYEDLV